MEKRKCPKCGKPVYSSVFNEDWECPYCGEVILVIREEVVTCLEKSSNQKQVH